MPDPELTVSPAGAMRTPGPSRFSTGSIIAGRYRLVALLGRGGMGEVYRAEDLTLDQTVALKFLPEHVADAGTERLTQFHNELRIARQVSHKNVCRLYDLGEDAGRRFLTMEYVDGEDLGSLLRRIGRFPQERAVAIARQLCAGVAAAHDRGVVHRDLKPANVMIDGEGNVRITDFGIATSGAGDGGGFAGTPEYMAPEQVAGQPASIRSDIYSLGLILFEIFTGKRVHDAKTIGELRAFHDTGTVTTPSSIVRDLDPGIERAILRCLERQPDRRPASALAVAAALPGGDPLAAALASGETPSPELLAAAGEAEALGVGRGVSAVVFVIACLAGIAAFSPYGSIPGRVPLDKSPAVLADRAQQILTSHGYTTPAADTAYDLDIAMDYVRWIAANDTSPRRWDVLKRGSPATLVFWHRTSPRLLVAKGEQLGVTTTDPPLDVSGMTLVILDTLGRMQEFRAIPPQFDPVPGPVPARWDALFDAAGLQLSAFTPVEPQWTPHTFADQRAAWEGPLADRPDARVRVEAAAYRGRPVSLLIAGPWSRPTQMEPLTRTTSQTVLFTLTWLILGTLVVAAVLLARQNLRTKRADARAVSRLALFMMIGYAVVWLLAAHHVPDAFGEISGFFKNFGSVLVAAGLFWVMYVGLEPYVRRFWPDGILGWTRLMAGYIRDPRVGRDVLAGCAFGAGVTVLEAIYYGVPPLLNRPAPIPRFQNNVSALTGISSLSATMYDHMIGGLYVGMFATLAFVLLRMIFRRTAWAVAALVLLTAVVQAPQLLLSGTTVWIAASFQIILIAMLTTMIVRYGLLATVVAFGLGRLLDDVPLMWSLSHWTATTSNVTIAAVLGLTFFGFYAARAGQSLFGNMADG